ncbi:hypothetical protein GCM10010489_35230 [Microbacterium saperdae]|uniref:DUF917 family protein n=1 Tax=Microbacterium saperdae TaxID=69368 RepID=A0A543BI55_9MICO|nr:hypothetical protein FB560_0068 [Microbacterium saperdae]GGM60623.1 hypothetical protein GCM10010489_35230 [Microbacterium saperdae]
MHVNRDLGVDRLSALAAGLLLLGSGGGGDPGLLAPAARAAIAERGLRTIGIDDLGDDDLVAPIGFIGSTSLLREKLPSGGEIGQAVDALRRWTGRNPTALMSIEMAGVNGFTPIVPAVEMGLPLVDADLAGRALPRLDIVSLVAAGSALVPCAVTGPGGQVIVLDQVDAGQVERLLREFVARTSGWGALALPFQTAAGLRDRVVTGTLERALRIGEALAATPASASALEMATAVGGRLLGAGRVLDSETGASLGGFDHTTVTVRDSASGSILRVEAENEFILAQRDGEMVATAPTIITLLAIPERRIVAVDDVRAGLDVAILALPAPGWWVETPVRAAHISPAAFGFEQEVVPW